MAAERKQPWSEVNPEYVVNDKGERTKVILDYQEYLDLLEDAEYEADVKAAQAALDSRTKSRPWREIRDEIEASSEPRDLSN